VQNPAVCTVCVKAPNLSEQLFVLGFDVRIDEKDRYLYKYYNKKVTFSLDMM
jgi:hypothetical protein